MQALLEYEYDMIEKEDEEEVRKHLDSDGFWIEEPCTTAARVTTQEMNQKYLFKEDKELEENFKAVFESDLETEQRKDGKKNHVSHPAFLKAHTSGADDYVHYKERRRVCEEENEERKRDILSLDKADRENRIEQRANDRRKIFLSKNKVPGVNCHMRSLNKGFHDIAILEYRHYLVCVWGSMGTSEKFLKAWIEEWEFWHSDNDEACSPSQQEPDPWSCDDDQEELRMIKMMHERETMPTYWTDGSAEFSEEERDEVSKLANWETAKMPLGWTVEDRKKRNECVEGWQNEGGRSPFFWISEKEFLQADLKIPRGRRSWPKKKPDGFFICPMEYKDILKCCEKAHTGSPHFGNVASDRVCFGFPKAALFSGFAYLCPKKLYRLIGRFPAFIAMKTAMAIATTKAGRANIFLEILKTQGGLCGLGKFTEKEKLNIMLHFGLLKVRMLPPQDFRLDFVSESHWFEVEISDEHSEAWRSCEEELKCFMRSHGLTELPGLVTGKLIVKI